MWAMWWLPTKEQYWEILYSRPHVVCCSKTVRVRPWCWWIISWVAVSRRRKSIVNVYIRNVKKPISWMHDAVEEVSEGRWFLKEERLFHYNTRWREVFQVSQSTSSRHWVICWEVMGVEASHDDLEQKKVKASVHSADRRLYLPYHLSLASWTSIDEIFIARSYKAEEFACWTKHCPASNGPWWKVLRQCRIATCPV